MMKRTALSTIGLAAALIVSVMAGNAFGQQAPAPDASNLINIRGVAHMSTFTPDFSYNLRGQSTRRDGRAGWLQVAAEFESAPAWIDELTVTFYVVLRGNPRNIPEGQNPVNMFTGSVTYMNVKQGRHMANMFLDPNTFERYGTPEAVAVVFEVDGRQAGGKVEPQRTAESRWWTTQTPLPIALLRRDQTPFSLVEIEQNLTIKP